MKSAVVPERIVMGRSVMDWPVEVPILALSARVCTTPDWLVPTLASSVKVHLPAKVPAWVKFTVTVSLPVTVPRNPRVVPPVMPPTQL